jgi:hypothetical protein
MDSPRIFIHIPKNGGMTIRRNPDLRKQIIVCTPDIHRTREYTKGLEEKMRSVGDVMGYEHARWQDLKKEVRQGYKSFAIVRNPWSRVVSRYWFAKKVIEVEKSSDHYGEHGYADISSFEAFLEERHKWGGVDYMWHRAVRGWYPAKDHVVDKFGTVQSDILRFENYNEDIKDYMGILFNPEPRNVTNLHKGTYQDMYTDKTIQIIADWYKDDIDEWGFDFDTGAQKNYWNGRG